MVRKELGELVSGLDSISLVLILYPEYLRHVHEVPFLDVVVALFPAMDIPFNSESLVADHETMACVSKCHTNYASIITGLNLHYWVELVPDHGAHFLHSELNTAIANKKNGPAVVLFLCSRRSTLAGSN